MTSGRRRRIERQPGDAKILERLGTYDFDGKNETAVREQWIYPLLDLLGYGAHTLDDVLFEDRLTLRQPLQRLVGSRVLTVDYRPTVLGKHLWLVEAKASAKDEDPDDVEKNLAQAWTYATHPEVNVPLIVLANGRCVRVHDVTAVDWDQPILDIEQHELPVRFAELSGVLGPRVVAARVRQRQLTYIRSALEAELDPTVCEQVVEQVRLIADGARPVISENQRRVRQHQARLNDALDRRVLAASGSWAVAQEHNIPLGFSTGDVDRAAQVILDRSPEERARQLNMYVDSTRFHDGLEQTWRPFWAVRALRFWVALRLRDAEGCEAAAEAIIGEASRQHLSLFADDPLLQSFHRWEGLLSPAVLRSLVLQQHDSLRETERRKLSSWDMERVLRAGLDPHRSALGATMLTCRMLWQKSRDWSLDDYESAAVDLQEILLSTDAVLAQGGNAAAAFLNEYVLAEAKSQRAEDDLVAYTILAIDADGADRDLSLEYAPMIAAATEWPGAVAPAAERLLTRLIDP